MKKYISSAYANRIEDTECFKDDVNHYTKVALEWMFTTAKDEIRDKFYKLDRLRGRDYADKVAKACNKQIKKKSGVDYDFYIRSSTSIECSTGDSYNVDSKYKLSQRSRNYLSKYIDLTQDVIDDIEQHAEEFDIKADISAYYEDIADFISDWVSIGYSTREAINLFETNEDEFLELPSGEILRFVM